MPVHDENDWLEAWKHSSERQKRMKKIADALFPAHLRDEDKGASLQGSWWDASLQSSWKKRWLAGTDPAKGEDMQVYGFWATEPARQPSSEPGREPDDDPIVERAFCSRHGQLAVRHQHSGWEPPIAVEDRRVQGLPVWCGKCIDAFLGQHMEPIAFRKE